MRRSKLSLVALLVGVGLGGVGSVERAALAQPPACAAPAAPPPGGAGTKPLKPSPKYDPETVYEDQGRLDAERGKVSNTRFSQGTTHGGGDKNKMAPTELTRWQIGVNQGTTDFLGSNASDEHKAMVIKNVVDKKIRGSKDLTYSEGRELTYELNTKGALPPDQEAIRAKLMCKTTNCLGKEGPPDFSDPNVFGRKDDFASLDAFMKGKGGGRNIPPPDPRTKLLGELDQSANDLKNAVVTAALELKDQAARDKAGSLIQGPRFDPNEIFARKLGGATNAEAKGEMKRLGDLLRAKSLVGDPKWGAYVDSQDLDAKIAKLLENKATVDKLTELRAEANEETKKTWGFRAQVSYMRSDDFWKKVQLAGDAGGKKLVADEVAKIAVVDPAAAKDVLGQLQDRFTSKLVDEMSEDELVRRLAAIETALGGNGLDILGSLKDGIDTTKATGKALGALEHVKELLRARARRGAAPDHALEALNKSNFAKTKLGNALLARLAESDKHGKLSGSAAGLGLLISGMDAANGELGKGTKKDADAVLAVIKAGDAFEAFAKWGAWQFAGKELAHDSALLRRLAPLAKLGPAADIIGGVVDTTRGIGSLHAGNAEKGYWQLAQGVGGFVSAGGTILILAGASGPGAPVVVLVGTVVVVIAKIGEMNSEKAPEVEFLRESDLLAKMPKDIFTRAMLQDRIRSYERDIATAQRDIENAKVVLDRHIGARPRDLENARNVRDSNRSFIGSAESQIEKAKKELDLVEKRLKDANINPSDWDGFSPQERIDRAKRAKTWGDAWDEGMRLQGQAQLPP